MPSVQYYNQTAPFWDWVSELEGRGHESSEEENDRERSNPWTGAWAGFPWGPMPYRGRPHPRHPPPPSRHGGPPSPPRAEDGEAGPSEARDPHPFSEKHGQQDREREHHHGPRRGPGARGGRCGRGRGGPCGCERGHFHPYGSLGPFGPIAEVFQPQLFGNDGESPNNKDGEDFKPEVDVFDTTEAFIVHIGLPGAKKEDVGVNWDAEKSELSVAGVIYRPGDEEFLKTLTLDERKIGAFERKVRLGSRANPAQVDVDGIVARLEDGLLRIEVPKQDSGYVEVKKVDIE